MLAYLTASSIFNLNISVFEWLYLNSSVLTYHFPLMFLGSHSRKKLV